MTKHAVTSTSAPAAIGPYSPALRAGGLLFLSGQTPLDPATGQIVTGDIRAQTRRVMENLSALLAAEGLNFSSVVRSTIFLADLGDFAVVNEIYGSYLSQPFPARTTVEVSRLPRDARIEIDMIAVA